MSGIGLTHIPAQPRRSWLAAAAVVAGLAIVVAGGYGLYNLGGQAGVGGQPSATPPAAPTPTLAPGTITTNQHCGVPNGGVRTVIDGVVQVRGDAFTCTSESSDPRLSGTVAVSQDSDEFDTGAWLAWGVQTITNEDGAWSGTYFIRSGTTASYFDFESVEVGTGAFDGLLAVSRVHVWADGTAVWTSRIVEAGTPVTGSETCSTLSAGRTIAADGVTAYRNVAMRCTDATSDPRVTGVRMVQLSIDERADGSADVWGTGTLSNDDGTWESFFFGTVDPGYTTHHVQALLHGSGAYDGLLFRLELTGSRDDGYQLSGEVVPAT